MAHSFIYTNYQSALEAAGKLATHPLDLIIVTNEVFDPAKKANKALTVDATREMIKSAYIAPLGESKVFVIPAAESMTINSQNAMLKLIEEPPPNVHFFFTTATPKALLATIISRSQIVYSEESSEVNSKIYSTLLPLCTALVGANRVRPRYALELALLNLKDNKIETLAALENIFSLQKDTIGDNILKVKMQKRISLARQQVKSNCNWGA
ncbi:MAG: hypothetical protein FWE47_01180, partial [Oscillospiraceae bacterium]|nr:hypothetical protein [Oscillospiraceae bacterium]